MIQSNHFSFSHITTERMTYTDPFDKRITVGVVNIGAYTCMQSESDTNACERLSKRQKSSTVALSAPTSPIDSAPRSVSTPWNIKKHVVHLFSARQSNRDMTRSAASQPNRIRNIQSPSTMAAHARTCGFIIHDGETCQMPLPSSATIRQLLFNDREVRCVGCGSMIAHVPQIDPLCFGDEMKLQEASIYSLGPTDMSYPVASKEHQLSVYNASSIRFGMLDEMENQEINFDTWNVIHPITQEKKKNTSESPFSPASVSSLSPSSGMTTSASSTPSIQFTGRNNSNSGSTDTNTASGTLLMALTTRQHSFHSTPPQQLNLAYVTSQSAQSLRSNHRQYQDSINHILDSFTHFFNRMSSDSRKIHTWREKIFQRSDVLCCQLERIFAQRKKQTTSSSIISKPVDGELMHILPGVVVLACLMQGIPTFYQLLPAALCAHSTFRKKRIKPAKQTSDVHLTLHVQTNTYDATIVHRIRSYQEVIAKMLRKVLLRLPEYRLQMCLPNYDLCKNLLSSMCFGHMHEWFVLPDATHGWPATPDATWTIMQQWIALIDFSEMFGYNSAISNHKRGHSTLIDYAQQQGLPQLFKKQNTSIRHLSMYVSIATDAVCLVVCLMYMWLSSDALFDELECIQLQKTQISRPRVVDETASTEDAGNECKSTVALNIYNMIIALNRTPSGIRALIDTFMKPASISCDTLQKYGFIQETSNVPSNVCNDVNTSNKTFTFEERMLLMNMCSTDDIAYKSKHMRHRMFRMHQHMTNLAPFSRIIRKHNPNTKQWRGVNSRKYINRDETLARQKRIRDCKNEITLVCGIQTRRKRVHAALSSESVSTDEKKYNPRVKLNMEPMLPIVAMEQD